MNRDAVKAQADALLRAAGFRDIEGSNGAITDDRHGREPDPTAADYYAAAEAQLARFPWRSQAHREVWWRHCQGERSRAIARAMGMHRNTVNNVIASVRAAMQARVRSRLGRPRLVGSLGDGCYGLRVRLRDAEAEALFHLASAWGCGPRAALRKAVLVVANLGCAIPGPGNSKK